MFRKYSYIFGALTGTAALAYGIKSKLIDDNNVSTIDSLHQLLTDSPKSSGLIEKGVTKTTFPLKDVISEARTLIQNYKNQVGVPGIVVGVSIGNETVWEEGFGQADIENGVLCTADTVMRIASISKSITMAVVAKLWQDGKLDLDRAVQEYVPAFPHKTYEGEEVTITTRQLVTHMAGIRHYKKDKVVTDSNNNNNNHNNSDNNKNKSNSSSNNNKNNKSNNINNINARGDAAYSEMYLVNNYDSVERALDLFKDDQLTSKPGTNFLYSTFGWTLVSAVVEAAAKEPFTTVMKKLFAVMGMRHTYLDENTPLIFNRSRYYTKDKRGRFVNARYADNSYKWAGGGFVSTVGDLLRFARVMMYSYQRGESGDPPGYLRRDTMTTMWTPLPRTAMRWGRGDGYGMGWVVVPARQEIGCGDRQPFLVGHSGGAVGASSVLLLAPTPTQDDNADAPSGIAVAIIANLDSLSLQQLAADVAAAFRRREQA